MAEQATTLVIVPCGLAKIWDKQPHAGPTAARHTYTGAPFVVNREYAERFGDDWVILSAKYGFLAPSDLVPGPYNVTFKRKATKPISGEVLRRQVQQQRLDRFDRVIGLGGKDYRGPIEQAFSGARGQLLFPFTGLALGVAMGATKAAVASGSPMPRPAGGS